MIIFKSYEFHTLNQKFAYPVKKEFESLASLEPNSLSASTEQVYSLLVVSSGPTLAAKVLPFTAALTGDVPRAMQVISYESTTPAAGGCHVTRAESPQFSKGKLAWTFRGGWGHMLHICGKKIIDERQKKLRRKCVPRKAF